MKLRTLTLVLGIGVSLVAASVGASSTADAAAKPGLLPGKWQGTGSMSGSVTDDVGTTTFTGKLGFRVTVRKNLSVTGKGSWVKTMKGRGIVSSTMTGIGFIQPIVGTASNIRFGWHEQVEGTVTANGITKRVEFLRAGEDATYEGRFVITRARKCSASGTALLGDGVKFAWTAKRVGRCSG